MATKLKNIKYSGSLKLTAFIIVWLSIMSVFGCSAFLLSNAWIMDTKSYYETSQFQNKFEQLVHDAVEFNIKLNASTNPGNINQPNSNRDPKIENQFSGLKNFAFYFYNSQTKEAFSNVATGDALAIIQNQPTAMHYSGLTNNSNAQFDDTIEHLLSGTPYEVYAAVIEPLQPGGVFYDDYLAFMKKKALTNYVCLLLAASLFLAFAGSIYLAVTTGRKEKEGPVAVSLLDRIYVDVLTLMVFLAAVFSVGFVVAFSSYPSIKLYTTAFVLGLDVLIGLAYGLSLIRQLKSRQILKNTLIYRFLNLCFKQSFKPGTLLLLLLYVLVDGFLFANFFSAHGGLSGLIFFLGLIAFNGTAIYFTAKALASLAVIMQAVREISQGNLDYPLAGSQISVALSGLAEDIQSIQGGLKQAVADAVKGERMKTDLITNVSHDLKTPLTSIINYIDLLKKEALNNDKAEGYLSILEEKSSRLKQLINDLIEASKASSGNLKVEKEKIDLHELVRQAYGEYEEKINQAQLNMQFNFGDEQTIISADGKHMWRIIENLLSNVLKYSLPLSRVYIEITQRDQYGLLIIKNISADPLNISPAQLTERFVRGDASRTTEGSGLGLSIAQSLTMIQGGKFSIGIDGDLFKVIVEVPLVSPDETQWGFPE